MGRSATLVALVVGLLAAGAAAFAGEHTVTLQQGQAVYGVVYEGTSDNTMYSYSGAADANYGRYPQLESNSTHRFLMKFGGLFKSQGGPVPDGATISSASLQIYKTSAYNYGPYSMYRVLKSWDELQATWNSAKTGEAWNSPGCDGAGTDRTADPVATPSCGWDPGWMTVDVTSSVQAWAGGAANEGWLLVDPYSNLRTWAARDYTADVTKRPKLVITYVGNTPPVAQAYALPSKGVAPFPVTFDASASTDVDGTIVSYAWTFGDGSDPASGERVEHVYTNPGTYTATLTITDDEGGADSKQFQVTAFSLNGAYSVSMQDGAEGYSGTRDSETYKYHPDGVHGFEATIRSGEGDNYRPVFRFATFTDEGGSIPRGSEILSATLCLYKTTAYSANWKVYQLKRGFVEGETSWNRASTAEAWAVPGAGGDGTDRVAGEVARPWMGWDPGWLMVDVTASLQNLSGGANNCGWLLVDQITGNIRAFAARENAEQTIRPKLLVTYRVPPTAVITTSPNPPKGLAPCTIQFSGAGSQDSDGTILFYYWQFGDGEMGEGLNVAHTYTSPGCFKATLSVTDDQGSTATASVFVAVAEEGAGTETLVLQDGLNGYDGTDDTYLDSYSPTTARGASETLNLAGSARPLVRFKIFATENGPVPAGRRVKDAKLALYKYSAYDSVVGAKRVLKNWNQAEATWNKANASTDWTVAGAKDVGQDVATGEEPLVTMPWDPAWVEFPVTSNVESFRTGALANNGWQIWYYWGNSNTRSFRSSEYAADTALRPKLTVQYSGNSAPVAFAESDIQGGSPPLGVQFKGTGLDVDGTIASYSWDFGDGSAPSSEQNPVHQYTSTGRYTATLTVTDDGGLTAQASVNVEVEQPYTLTFQRGDGGSYSETEDCNLKSDYPSGQNEAGSIYLEAFKSDATTRRCLIRLPNVVGHAEGQIPHDAKIVSAKLRLSLTGAAQNQQIAVHRVTEGWSIPYGAPWWNTRRAGGATWGAPGCAYIDEEHKSRVQAPEDTQALDGRPFPYEWDVTAAVQAWANDADLNHGLVVEMPMNGPLMGFRSSEHNETALRPILLVTISDLPDITKPKLAITSQLTSQTRKAFVEGTKDPEVDTISLTADGNPVEVTVTNPTHWFAFVERDGSNSVELMATATDSAGNQTQATDTLSFLPLDPATDLTLLMQTGDSALVTVNSGHPNAGSVQIVPGDGGSNVTGSLGDTLEVRYEIPGNFSATVNVQDSEGSTLETHELDITVITVALKEGVALQAKQGYGGSGPEPYYEVTVEPASASALIQLLAEKEDLLTVRPREVTDTGVQSRLVLERPSVAYVQTRLEGVTGRVVARNTVTGFKIEASHFLGNATTREGFASVTMTPKIPDLRMSIELGFGGTYLDGTTEKSFSSNDMDEDGVLVFDCFVPETAPDFETTTRVYQELSPEQQVGTAYMNTMKAMLELNPVMICEMEVEDAGGNGLSIEGSKWWEKSKPRNHASHRSQLYWVDAGKDTYQGRQEEASDGPVNFDSAGTTKTILPDGEKPKYPSPLLPGAYDVLAQGFGKGFQGKYLRFRNILTIVDSERTTLVVEDGQTGNHVKDSTDPLPPPNDVQDYDDEVLYISENDQGKAPIQFDIVLCPLGGDKSEHRWRIEKRDGTLIAGQTGFSNDATQRWEWDKAKVPQVDGKPLREFYVSSWLFRVPEGAVEKRRIRVVVVDLQMHVFFKMIESETEMTAEKTRDGNFYRTLGGMKLRLEGVLYDTPVWATDANWSATGGRLTFDEVEKKVYWQFTDETKLDKISTTIFVEVTFPDGGTFIKETNIRSRTLRQTHEGDDVRMLQSFLHLIGISSPPSAPGTDPRHTTGWQGTPIRINGNLDANTAEGVNRFQKRDEIEANSRRIVTNVTLQHIQEHWADYVAAYEAFSGSPKIDTTHAQFDAWLDAGEAELAKTYDDAKVREVDPNVTRKELLAAWVKKEAGIGHWGYQSRFRVVLGGFDDHGSIGFSQIQNRFKYGAERGVAGLKDVNLYHPREAVRGFALWSNDRALGGGFFHAFVNAEGYKRNKTYALGEWPRLGDPDDEYEYEDQTADRLSKGLGAYKQGASVGDRLFFKDNWPWPELLKGYPNKTTTTKTIKDALWYALKIKSDAGISLANRKWMWYYTKAGNPAVPDPASVKNSICIRAAAGQDLKSTPPPGSDDKKTADGKAIHTGANGVRETPLTTGDVEVIPPNHELHAFEYSEQDWFDGKSWQEKRDE